MGSRTSARQSSQSVASGATSRTPPVVAPADGSPAGRGADFGWSAFEGNERFNGDVADSGRTTPPVLTYRHSDGCSISGGAPYRGSAIAELTPAFVYSDYCTGTIWALDLGARHSTDFPPYREEGHLPLFSRRAAKKYGGRQVPVLATEREHLRDSTDILAWVDQRLPDAHKLYPSAPHLRCLCQASHRPR